MISFRRVKRSFVTGGTQTPDIPASAFAMGPGMRMRYDQPAAALSDYITGYTCYASDSAAELVDWFLPAPVMINISFDAGPISAAMGSRKIGAVPQVALYGPTTWAMRLTTHGGVMIGTGVSALGWSRLFRRSASDIHNRIVPLSEFGGADMAERMLAALTGLGSDRDIKGALDAVLADLLGPVHPDEPLIRQLALITVTRDILDVGEVARQLGLAPHQLRALSRQFFGMTPKLLLRRARFLRSLLRLFAAGDAANYDLIDKSYFDASHFLRDAETFLGTTPRRFMARPTTFLAASIRARAAVLGVGTQALHDPARLAFRSPVDAT